MVSDGVAADACVPVAVRVDPAAFLFEIEWVGGSVTTLPHRALRLQCRCAGCEQGRRQGTAAAVDPSVCIVAVEPFGPNAVRLHFSDGHARGVFPFHYLRQLAGTAGAARASGDQGLP